MLEEEIRPEESHLLRRIRKAFMEEAPAKLDCEG